MGIHAKGIYVQIDIRAPLERVWQLTQTPDLHRQWDLRFSDIRYLPRSNPAEPQRFLYATRIGFGLDIRGEGETVGSRDSTGGQRTSALKFWSQDPKSLIREGSGYWQYVPGDSSEEMIRFLTGYDYGVRFGLGRVFDRLVFRPLIGWATAWSFDRLRMWVERGIDPAESMRRTLIYLIARLTVAFVWIYHGVVPKLVFRHRDELAMLADAGLASSASRAVCVAVGWGELVFGLIFIVCWSARWPLRVTMAVMPAAVLGVALGSPRFLGAAFNPVSLNVSVFALAAIALKAGHDLPSARRCVRRPPRGDV